MSDGEGLNDTVGRLSTSLSIPAIPSPDPYVGGVSAPRIESFWEICVPLGVPVGVELGLSTRTLRGPDLGVMLWLRNVETGVGTSSFPTGVVLTSDRAGLRDDDDPTLDGLEPATLGVNGVRLAVFVEALRVGMSGLEALCLSYGGILFGLPFVKGGTRIMALPSLDWRGGR